ncbi:MAG: hypothetical protein BJ554DRAFT_3352 [Olpidium bornovanus]|uniref:Uncharacterized protein n=1 Tax=Olpidium bornovanus TaxID=278681 RepID=A0A8H7ZPC6_9FUNG|nr:MAG: hypothetical protein BJ554DRAFT_3352 [Olpidium bornovanus]
MALAAFVTNAPTQAQSNVSECEAEQLACDFQRALYSWQFPLAQPSPHQAAAIVRFLSRTRSGQHIYGKKGDALASELGDDRAEYEQFKARETQWRQAFRSLYYSMRQAVEVDRVPETRHFYVIADEFSVLFRARIGSSSFSATTGILRAAGAPEVKADVDSEAESDRSLGHFVLETPTKASRAPVNASVETAIPESLVAAIKSRQSKGVSGATSPSPKDQLDMNHDGLVV